MGIIEYLMTIVEDSRLCRMKLLDLFRERLKTERQRLGLTQAQLGAAAKIDRRTQYKYEIGTNEPNISYLKGVESAGVDIPFTLFGQRSDELIGTVDWPLLWQAVEDVALFTSRRLPDCSDAIKRDLVERLYLAYQEHKQAKRTLTQRHERNLIVDEIWNEQVNG
ncbi:helix-turn-helix transcriptional regulator [Rhodoferax sp.]|uniref:helix-turn-helix domain-containing protein n=1 Tax=Rhodoferax sp. TaxID=50421 RepID=UPI0025F3C8CE|nr:helix-turn-helix transcriptional regulator [Rhodoferax sp.]